MKSRLHILGAAMALTSVGTHAQDSRAVREPVMPPACAVLIASSAAPGLNDAARIQAAIDKCAPGHAVHLAPSNEKHDFVSGPLVLKSGVTLVVDQGATLYASTDPRLFDRGSRTCGTNDKVGHGCRPLIWVENATGSGIMGEGTIDGQGGHLIDGKTETWWQIARRAQKENTRQNVPRLLEVSKSKDFTLYRITLRNSPNFHVTLYDVDGFTAWSVKINTPRDARNTDGIDPISSRNVTITHSWISTGDDNVAIKAGNLGPVENISVVHNHFYYGHGMSIGSETNGGVHHILVDDLDMDGTTSGLRIKSNDTRGGVVDTTVFRNVCLRDVKAPIDVYTHYEQQAKPGHLIPSYADVSFENVHSLTAGRINLKGYDERHPLRAVLRNVVIDGKPRVETEFAQLSGQLNAQGATALDCSHRFAAFPQPPVKNTRPQLTAEQAKAYDYREVMKYTGPVGNERVDPWDPLADPLATGASFKADYVVDQHAKADNQRTFTSVQAAVSHAIADAHAGKRIYIEVKPGVYNELVYVSAAPAPITLYSNASDPAATRISAGLDASTTGTAYAQRFGAEFAHVDSSIKAMFDEVKAHAAIGTFGSQTVWVKNAGFQARNLTIENAYNKAGGDTRGECGKADCPQNPNKPMNVVHHQAVALSVDGADKAQFENVRLLGFQDTLYVNNADDAHVARAYFNKSYIEGDVDFIFGDATAYFNDCEVKTLSDRPAGYATAPDTHLRARYGFVFNGCRFTSDGKPEAKGRFYLARQWFHNERCTPFGSIPVDGYSCRIGDVDRYQPPVGTIRKRTLESVGKVVIMNSRVGAHINRVNPWADWNSNGTLPYRPAQYSSDDYWNNLSKVGLDPTKVLGEGPRPALADIFLAEYNNTNE
jgi:polygalacturonase